MSQEADLRSARAVADAVMYEGYLLYPYRASAAKNQVRWQFGVLGPQGAAAAGAGEEPDLSAETLVRRGAATTVTIRLRFLQLQSRSVQAVNAAGAFVDVDELEVDGERWLTWDEAVPCEVVAATVQVDGRDYDERFAVSVDGVDDEITELSDRTGRTAGRLVRSRRPLNAMVEVRSLPVDPEAAAGLEVSLLQVLVENLANLPDPRRKEALGLSLLGAHLLLTCESGEFISLLDPPVELQSAAQDCQQHRCWPVLAGPVGSADTLLVSPIILEDHPRLADESVGDLFDSTEIDEILTLRILTMTDQERSQARATDPRAAQILDRSEDLSFDEMARMHGALRNPHAVDGPVPTWNPPPEAIPTWETVPDSRAEVPSPGSRANVPWWDPESDANVDPGVDTVMVAGQAVGRGSLVRLRPNRRADAQDLFFSGQIARVTGVHFDVDGATHVGVVLVDDPAADVHEWYGRFLYFAPDEIQPIGPSKASETTTKIPEVLRKES